MPDKKPRDPMMAYLIMQYIRTGLMFLGLIVIAIVINHIGAR